MHSISDSQLIAILEASQYVPEKILTQIRKRAESIPPQGLVERLLAEGLLTSSTVEQLQDLLDTLEDLFAHEESRMQTQKRSDISTISIERKKDILFARQVINEGLCTIADINKCFAEQAETKKTQGKELRLGQIMVKNHVIPVNEFVKLHKKIGEQIIGTDLQTLIEADKNLRPTLKGGAIVFVEASIPEKFGPYRIIEEVARGGMGVVYKAWDEKLRRTLALKVLKEWDSPPLDEIQRFHREARLAASLKHPGIVNIYEAGTVEGVHYFTMDYVEGETLSEYMERETPSTRESLIIIQQVTIALAYAHSRDIIHRDVKPGNIMLDSTRRPLLTDFGLAKSLSSESLHLTHTQATIGTPAYMSPEQAKGDTEVDARSDIYSLGAVLYEMLTGRPPFEGSIGSIMSDVQSKEPVLPSKLNPSLHPDVEVICCKAMAKDPEQRYATAKDMAEDLERFLRGENIKTRQMSVSQKMWKKTVQYWPKIVALIVLIAVCTAIGGWLWLEKITSRQRGAAYFGEGKEFLHHGSLEMAVESFQKAAQYPGFDEPVTDLLRETADKYISITDKNLRGYEKQEAHLDGVQTQAIRQLQLAQTVEQKREALFLLENIVDDRDKNYQNLTESIHILQNARLFQPFDPRIKKLLRNLHLHRLANSQLNQDRQGVLWNLSYADYYAQDDGNTKDLIGGTLDIQTKPQGAKVYLFGYCKIFRHFVPVPWKVLHRWHGPFSSSMEIKNESLLRKKYYFRRKELFFGPESELGVTPLHSEPLLPGFYLVVIKTSQYIEVHIPVKIFPRKKSTVSANLHKKSPYLQNFYQIDLPNTKEDYFVSIVEVSCAEYSRFLNDRHFLARYAQLQERIGLFVPRLQGMGELWRKHQDKYIPEHPQQPVVGVSWYGAILYCRWRNEKSQGMYTFRLPYREEWEWIAGKVNDFHYPWGNDFDWIFIHPWNSKQPSLQRCGESSFDISPFGIRDMAGNVREWCLSQDRRSKHFAEVKGGSWKESDGANIGYTATYEKKSTADDLGFRIIAKKNRRK